MHKGVSFSQTRAQGAYWYQSRLLLWMSTPLVVLTLLAISSFVHAQLLQGKIYPGTQVGGVDVGGLVPELAEDKLEAEVARYQLEPVTLRDGTTTWSPSLNELGLSFDIEQTVRQAFHSGRTNLLGRWFVAPVHAGSDSEVLASVVETPELEQYVQWLAEQVDEPAVQPRLQRTAAGLTFRGGMAGSVLDQGLVKAQVLQQVARFNATDISLSFEAENPLTEATLLADLAQEAVEKLVTPLRLTTNAQEFIIPLSELETWITLAQVEDAWQLAFSHEKAAPYLRELLAATKLDPETTQRYAAAQETKPIREGKDGQEPDIAQLLLQLEEGWREKGQTEFTVPFRPVPKSVEYLEVTAPRNDGKVIFTDLSKQTMFAFEDGVLQFYTLMSSGKPWTPTVPGTFKVYTKVRRQVMSGPGYYLPNVEWVMYYDGDYGIHSAYWHNNFGHPMSHGCSNLPTEAAQRFYEFAEVGTPVIIVGETPRS